MRKIRNFPLPCLILLSAVNKMNTSMSIPLFINIIPLYTLFTISIDIVTVKLISLRACLRILNGVFIFLERSSHIKGIYVFMHSE